MKYDKEKMRVIAMIVFCLLQYINGGYALDHFLAILQTRVGWGRIIYILFLFIYIGVTISVTVYTVLRAYDDFDRDIDLSGRGKDGN